MKLKIIPILTILLLSTTNIYADDFYPSGNSLYNKYLQTVSYSSRNLPLNSNTEDNVVYNPEHVNTMYTDDVLDMNFWDLATCPYGQTTNCFRKNNYANRIAVPPGTQIDIVYTYFNATEDLVDIKGVKTYITGSDPEKGNLQIFDNIPAGDYQCDQILYDRYKVNRCGLGWGFEELGYVNTSDLEDPPEGVVLGSFKIKQPMQFKEWSISLDENRMIAYLSLTIFNYSTEYLNNVKVIYGENENIDAYPPMEEKTFSYTVPFVWKEKDWVQLGFFKIVDPNTKEVCVTTPYKGAIYGGQIYTVISQRGYFENPNWVSSILDIPLEAGSNSFCVKRIGYEVNSPLLEIDNREPVQEEEVPKQEVLAVTDEVKIEELPDTGKYPYFLIIFPILFVLLVCYYCIYEKESKYTKLCKRSSKKSPE